MFRRRRHRNDVPWRRAAIVGALALWGTSALADPLPPSVAAVIDAAAATGKAATLKTVVQMVKKAYPASAAEIDAQVAALQAKAEKARQEKLAHQGLFGGISGEGQLGFSNSTGGSNTLNVTGGAKITKESLHWKNTLTLDATYKKESGILTDEKYVAGIESRYKLSGNRYLVGILYWDRDPFSGYTNRSAAAIGLGAVLIKSRDLTLSLDASTAARSIDYIATHETPAHVQTDAMARIGAAFSWTIWPGTTFTDNLTSYIGSGDKTVTSITAFTTKIAGALSARMSFQLDYDSLLPPGYDDINTETRVTLVFAF
jgi:putative salt-induced outer membrane protein